MNPPIYTVGLRRHFWRTHLCVQSKENEGTKKPRRLLCYFIHLSESASDKLLLLLSHNERHVIRLRNFIMKSFNMFFLDSLNIFFEECVICFFFSNLKSIQQSNHSEFISTGPNVNIFYNILKGAYKLQLKSKNPLYNELYNLITVV